MNCVSCGKTIGDGDRFCMNCGARQPEPETVAVEETAAPEEPVIAAEPVAVEEPVNEEPASIEEPVIEEPVSVEEPAIEEPAPIEEPVIEEPTPIEEPVTEEPVVIEEPTPVEEPVLPEEPAITEPEPVQEDVVNVIDSVLQNDIRPTAPAAEVPEEPFVYSTADYEPEPEFTAPGPENYMGGPMQPPPPQYQPSPEEFAQPAAEPEVKVGALRLTGATIVSFFTVIIMLVVTLLVCVKLGITGDAVEKRMKKMDPGIVFSAEYEKGLRFSDAIYNESGFSRISGGAISSDEFFSYICKIDALGFAGSHAREYLDYILDGKGNDPSVTTNELADLFVDNREIAEEVFHYELQTADYNAVRSTFNKKDTASNFSIGTFSEKLGFRLENMKYIVSPVTIGIFGALLLVLLIWIILIVDKRGRHLLSFYGSVFCWSGNIIFVIGALVTAGAAVAHVFTGMFVFYLCASLLLPFGIYALCIGGAEYILGRCMKRVRKVMRIKQKRNEAVKQAVADRT